MLFVFLFRIVRFYFCHCAVDPGFYSSNLLMIGKTYQRMKENELAKQFLIKARDYPVRTEDDKKVGIRQAYNY